MKRTTAQGKKEEAAHEGKRAVELLPVSKDAMNGPKLIEYLAVIYVWTGETTLVLEEVAKVAQIPSRLDYGELRLHTLLGSAAWRPTLLKSPECSCVSIALPSSSKTRITAACERLKNLA